MVGGVGESALRGVNHGRAVFIVGNEDEARFGAQLPRTQREGGYESATDLRTMCPRRRRGHNHRIEAGELAVEGDGFLASSDDVHQCLTTAERTGEPDRFDGGIADQCRPSGGAVNDAESGLGGAGRVERVSHQLEGQLGRARVRAMRLNNDGVAGS